MKKILFFALGLSAIFNSCIWKNDYNYCHSAAHDMYYSWEYNTSSIMNNYVVKAFMFNVWWEGNDTVRSLVEEHYFGGYKNVRQAGENTYELCANPNLPSDWYYRFETNGTSLNTVGATWTVYANAIYKDEEDGYYSGSVVFSTLLTKCKKITITCVGEKKWDIVCDASASEHNDLQWTMQITNQQVPFDIKQASMILTGNSSYELPGVSEAGDTTYTYLFAEIEEPLECSKIFTPQYGKVKLWAERNGERSKVTVLADYQQGDCTVTESK
jgi:hypothetical protein